MKLNMSCTLAHTRTCHMLYEPSMLSPTCIIRFRNSLLLTAIPLHYQVEKYDEVAQRAYTFGRGMGRRPIPLPWYGPKAHTTGSGIPLPRHPSHTICFGRNVKWNENISQYDPRHGISNRIHEVRTITINKMLTIITILSIKSTVNNNDNNTNHTRVRSNTGSAEH